MAVEKNFDSFDLSMSYEGVECFSPIKEEALYYTHWDNGDDDWRTIKEAEEYLYDEGWRGSSSDLLTWENDKMEFENEDEKKKYVYNIILSFYKEQYGTPTLYYCYIRNASKNKWYDYEYDVEDEDDIWVVKKEAISYKDFPEYPSEELNTYSW